MEFLKEFHVTACVIKTDIDPLIRRNVSFIGVVKFTLECTKIEQKWFHFYSLKNEL